MPTELARFHPAVANWFGKTFAHPTEPQAKGWPTIQRARHTLIAAPTGSGKTLAAFLAAIDVLVRESLAGALPDACQVLYISPLKALSNDIQRNLQQPLAGIAEELEAMGLPRPGIRVLVRTGDTPASERAAMIRRPPHILVTTPESLYILLTSEGGRRILRTVRQVIVDEIHALVADKRGSHLALSLERLQALTGAKLVRVGLSATQRPIETVARFLVGCGAEGAAGNPPACSIVDVGHWRKLDLAIELPDSPLEAVMSLEVWEEVFDRLAALVKAHRTTLIFVNTRRMAERLARHLSERLGEEHVSSHHGSMSKEHRLTAEQRLKGGKLRALVATASLELGIDIGAVELVCQLASPRSITAFLQRVGRSGHTIGGLPRGRLFPLSRDDLVECAALLDAVRRGELDTLSIPDKPLDILAQQIVAAVACEEWSVDDLFNLVRRAYPYRDLARSEFDRVVRMLAEGFSARRGRRGAHLHWDAVNGRLRGRKGARLAAVTSGGAIPDNADYDVILEPAEIKIGTLNEDFAIESMAGDIFQLGNSSWRIRRVESGKVRVEDAQGQPPTIPFWLGEAPGRSHELSAAVSRLRAELDERMGTPPPVPADAPTHSNGEEGSGTAISTAAVSTAVAPTAATILAPAGSPWGEGAAAALAWLKEEVGLSTPAAEQLTDYLAAARAALGVMPTQQTLVMERFFDEAGGMQLVIHSPYGSRLNRAWGLALRKRFCRKFNFELQAAAVEDAIVLSLGPTHSFPLQDVYRYLHSASVRELLIQAMLDAPMFTTRWRWNASRALALLRWRSGRKVPAPLQRMDAEDLMAVVFPDQLACQENVAGDRDIPDHPLVNQTIHDCLTEAMDIEALESLLRGMESGDIRMVARDMAEPSPLAQEILNAKPYAFLDDAPLEERRTQAVINRRWLDAASAAELGALDVAAIARVRAEAWPQPTSADEMHDTLVLLGTLTEREVRAEEKKQPEPAQPAEQPPLPFRMGSPREGSPPAPEPLPGAETFSAKGWHGFLASLVSQRRATLLRASPEGPALWVAAERLPELVAVHPGAALEPVIAAPPEFDKAWEKQDALVELLRGRLEGLGPVTAAELAESLAVEPTGLAGPLAALEAEGFVLRGNFTPGSGAPEWCERRLLARINRYTLTRLRQEIEPVSPADFMRFLLTWQKVEPETHAEGQEGLAAVLDQLEGFEAPAAAWEEEILPARLDTYETAWLDNLCLSGRQVWARLTPPGLTAQSGRRWAPVRSTPIALVGRKNAAAWASLAPQRGEPLLSSPADEILRYLQARGASFFSDLVEAGGLLPTQVEMALAELVALGLITSDGFVGLRALVTPAHRRAPVLPRGRRKGSGSARMESAGRWATLAGQQGAAEMASKGGASKPVETVDPETVALVAWTLLRRYGVVFKRLLAREGLLPPWRELLRQLRRLETRGEVRGGRFVGGFAGEQFALPEAVGLLRNLRRTARHNAGGENLIALSAADPLNLVGIVVPGDRVAALATNRILFRGGLPLAVREGGRLRFLAPLDAAGQWQAQSALLGRRTPVSLAAFRRSKE